MLVFSSYFIDFICIVKFNGVLFYLHFILSDNNITTIKIYNLFIIYLQLIIHNCHLLIKLSLINYHYVNNNLSCDTHSILLLMKFPLTFSFSLNAEHALNIQIPSLVRFSFNISINLVRFSFKISFNVIY